MGSTQSSPSDKLSRQQEYEIDKKWYDNCINNCRGHGEESFWPCIDSCRKSAFPVCKYPEFYNETFLKIYACKQKNFEKLKFDS